MYMCVCCTFHFPAFEYAFQSLIMTKQKWFSTLEPESFKVYESLQEMMRHVWINVIILHTDTYTHIKMRLKKES